MNPDFTFLQVVDGTGEHVLRSHFGSFFTESEEAESGTSEILGSDAK